MTETILRFVHITDTHLSPETEYGRHHHGAAHSAREGAIALVETVNALPFQPDFILHTGDVVYDPDPAAYGVAKSILSRLKAPVPEPAESAGLLCGGQSRSGCRAATGSRRCEYPDTVFPLRTGNQGRAIAGAG